MKMPKMLRRLFNKKEKNVINVTDDHDSEVDEVDEVDEETPLNTFLAVSEDSALLNSPPEALSRRTIFYSMKEYEVGGSDNFGSIESIPSSPSPQTSGDDDLSYGDDVDDDNYGDDDDDDEHTTFEFSDSMLNNLRGVDSPFHNTKKMVRYRDLDHFGVITQMYGSVWKNVFPFCVCNVLWCFAIDYMNTHNVSSKLLILSLLLLLYVTKGQKGCIYIYLFFFINVRLAYIFFNVSSHNL